GEGGTGGGGVGGGGGRGERGGRARDVQHGRHHGKASQDARLASHDVRDGLGAGRYDGRGGDVGTVTQVLLQGGAHDPVQVAWVQCHAAAPFDGAGAMSLRRWQPRLWRRASAASATSVETVCRLVASTVGRSSTPPAGACDRDRRSPRSPVSPRSTPA